MRIIKHNTPEIAVECTVCQSILGARDSDINYSSPISCIRGEQFSAVCPACENRFIIKIDVIPDTWKTLIKEKAHSL